MPTKLPLAGRHRGPAQSATRKGLSRTVRLSGVALAATGLAVSAGMMGDDQAPGTTAAAASLSDSAGQQGSATSGSSERTLSASRSDRRTAVDPAKQVLLSQESGGQATKTEDLSGGDPKDIARAMLIEFGFGAKQFGCLDSLWSRESGWRPNAANPSGAYGIPQALPGSKMSSAGADWRSNPATQIRWGLGYIKDRYGSPCGAWGHSQSRGWY